MVSDSRIPLGAIPVIFENGVFRPEAPVDIPDRSRLLIVVERQEQSDQSRQSELSLKAEWEALRARGLVRSGGWRPTREELHDRR